MASFDLTHSDLTPWLADRLLSDHFIEERRRAAFLWRHFRAPGLLGGLDLADGAKYSALYPTDPAAFLLAHTLGPARIDKPPKVMAVAKDGAKVEVASFFRTLTNHVTDDQTCQFVVVHFAGQNALAPEPTVLTASRALTRAGFPHAVERCFQIGVWHLWIVFKSPVPLARSQGFGSSIRAAIESAGVAPDELSVPLIDGDSSPVYLPYHFFSGDYFANLHELDEDGGLVAMNPNRIEAMEVDLTSCEPTNASPVAIPVTSTMTQLLQTWHTAKGGGAVRAGELDDLLTARGIVLPELAHHKTRQARAINLGRILMEQASQRRHAGWMIQVGKSGHSNTFRLERTTGDDSNSRSTTIIPPGC